MWQMEGWVGGDSLRIAGDSTGTQNFFQEISIRALAI
jgi:hypothetical protein